MERESGYYWVMRTPNSSWEVAHWSGSAWYIDIVRYKDGELSLVHEERIKDPYENIDSPDLLK